MKARLLTMKVNGGSENILLLVLPLQELFLKICKYSTTEHQQPKLNLSQFHSCFSLQHTLH